jgi:hypothetical protein
MYPENITHAEYLEGLPIKKLDPREFRYQKGEPANADVLWSQVAPSENEKDGLSIFHFWNTIQVWLFWWSLGLAVIGCDISFDRKTQFGWVPYAILAWNVGATWAAFYSVGRMKISGFDHYVIHAFQQARSNPKPWMRARFAGEAYRYVQASPCWSKRLEPFQAQEGTIVPNSFDYILAQLREGVVHALRTLEPQQNGVDSSTAEHRYQKILEGLLKLVPQLKNRWFAWAENRCWILFLLNWIEAMLYLRDK